MARLASSIKGKMIISVNDIPEMHGVFRGLTIERADIRYSLGGGGRGKPKLSQELIIKNW